MEVVVSASTGVMKPLLSKLTRLLEEEYAKLKGVRKQIKFLRDELIPMSETLQILADAEHLSGHMKDWRDKLRELAYDIEDCVDNFMVRVDRDGHKGFKAFKGFVMDPWPQGLQWLKELQARREIAHEIEELKNRVMEVSKRHKRYSHVAQASNSSTVSIDPRLPALYEEIDMLVGIDGPKKHIIEKLSIGNDSYSTTELKVLSIAGCGGLGKTTLANQVYHSIESQFKCTAFVSVSRTPDMRKIFRDIARSVGITDNTLDNDDVRQLIDKLREHLKDKRYFIVIDDVWDEKVWETIGYALFKNNCRSRVITTTRSIEVAERSSSQGGYVYQMEPLSFVDSKRLFFKRVFGYENSCNPHLEDVPDRILKKCGGLPLAIITVSSMLSNEHARAEWDWVLNAIGSALAKSKNPDAEKMTSILSLSYFDLPHHLRTCLLYLSVFPEDHRIEKQCLINRWIAEGFIHEEQERSAYEIGERYFNDLINRSMTQPAGDVKYGQVKACRVHDIILDYIKCKAAEENFVTTLDAAEHGYTSEYKVRRLCVNRNEENVAGLILPKTYAF